MRKPAACFAAGLTPLGIVSTGKASLEELSKVRTGAEVFSRKRDARQEEEYAKWKKLIGLLRSSKGSFLAE